MKTLLLFLVLIISVSDASTQQAFSIDSAQIDSLIEFSKNTFTDEILVIHKDSIICHWRDETCDSTSFNTASMVKSWTGLIIGIMIDSGLIKSEDDLVCTYLPEWKDGCHNDVTIKHLLTMSAGINRKRGAEGILAQENMNDYVLNVKLDTQPGIRFNYSNESVQLLGQLIEKVSGLSANDYFQKALFHPLEMFSTVLGKDRAHNDIVYGGAVTTVDDASKIGLLMLNKGMYKGKQIVSEDWVSKSVSPSDKAGYYGYLWWLDNNSTHPNFAATGDFGQMTIVFPDLDMIYIRRQSCNKDVSGNMTWMGPAFLELLGSVVKVK